MTMTDLFLRYCYGGVVIASGLLIGSMGRLGLREIRAIGLMASFKSLYVWLAVLQVGMGASLILICGVRGIDSFHGKAAGSVLGPFLLTGFIGLLLCLIGFNWAATRQLKTNGKAIWWGSVISLVLWGIFVLIKSPGA